MKVCSLSKLTLLISNSSRSSTDSAVEVADIYEFTDPIRVHLSEEYISTFELLFKLD